ncbi:MAG: lysophospholipase [Lachnospiraceae bacterium]|nr:lysophospholipase [Lachnospiraceae bacterium]
MKKTEFYIPSNDGITKLHGYAWAPDVQPRFILQLVHGMVEYIDRYDAFASFLAANDIAVIGHDHLGHGKSITDESKLGFFAEKEGYRIVIDDMHAVTEEGKKRFPGVKNYILGHSMGSFMVRRFLAVYPKDVDGAIIMGTGYIPAGLAGVGKTMSKVVKGTRGGFHQSKLLTNLALGSNNKPFEPARTPCDWLSRNKQNVDKYMADPLCGFMFTASAYADFFTVIQKIAKLEDYDKIPRDLPLLLTSGELDPVGGKDAVEKLAADYEKLGFTDVTVQLYPEDRHEILNEVDRDKVYADILAWLVEKAEG